ncbi:MAG TPA: DUF3618 domain-containing protein [Steroidobacteraceae bacterium]|jgi:hypothetical protein
MNATSPPDRNADRNPEQLEQAADRIRADLDRTLGELERKLSPSQLLDRSLAYLREHGGDMTHAIGETVRRNPVPILLTVAGIGWLIASSLRQSSTVNAAPLDEGSDEASSYADEDYPSAGAGRTKFQERVAATRERLYAAREQTRRAQHRMTSVVTEQPILLGSLAVAIGALIGAVVPSTQYEDRTVGQIRDRAMERAKQMGERQYQNLRSRLETHRDLEVSGRAH